MTTLLTRSPLIIAHRGASGYRPEHTLAGYELAARLGADYLEPDLVSTRDGVLVARHEPEIGETTDVAQHPEFAGRRTVREIDGVARTGWFAGDFSLDELRTLRAVERIPAIRPRNTRFDGQFPIPTFDEILALAGRLTEELGRPIGVYPETKHPSYHASIGLPLEPLLLRSLRDFGLDRPDAPVFVQSFEVNNLRELRAAGLSVPLVQLLSASGGPADNAVSDYQRMTTPEGLARVARYASAIGPDKSMLDAALVDDAHAAGLAVHPYTFRAEPQFIPLAHPDAVAEIHHYLQLGVDAIFTDNTDAAVFARAEFVSGTWPYPEGAPKA
ncbi:glycerophosphodiester phosphodiesterase [Pseudonocardia spinosispora]|uniref:glycerophosphodiester phosphodiesterase n=1 Tax=Pseudonocardia spinosispora TaxID=103441 RepID=UPI00041D172B|nr:glycerophosphodiester phosphodiesterase [Pseudonocardia spinosispora]